MAGERHAARQHRSAVAGLEAVSLLSGRSFPRHAHDQFGIGVIRSGAHRSWSGIGSVEATAGDIITGNPGEVHDGTPVRGGVRGWQMIYFEPDLVMRVAQEDTPGFVEIARPVLHDPALSTRFARLFGTLAAPRPDALGVEEDMVRLLAHVAGRHGNRTPRRPAPPPHVARALQRLEEAPQRPATLAELAGLSGVSRYQLLRGFARAVGTTPHAFLVQQRVRLARRLLGRGWRLAEAAVEAGFADQSHMTRAFVRQLGVTPARYRAAVA